MTVFRYLSARAARNRSATGGGGGGSGSDTLIGYYTIQNLEGAKTNEIVEFGFPNLGTDMPAGRSIKVVEVAGSSTLLAQADNIRSNMDDGLERFRKITCILSALDASAGSSPVRQLAIYSTTAALPTGTAITVADMVALSAMSSGLVAVEFTDELSVLYSANIKTIFTSGTSTWSKTGKWICPDLIRSGPLCTEWRVRMAPESSTGTLHGGTGAGAGDGIHVEMHVAAFKAGLGAVSASNPIIAVKAIVCPQNEDAGRSFLSAYPTSNTARDHWYGLNIGRATDLSVGTLLTSDQTSYPYGPYRMSYPVKNPTGTLSVTEGAWFGPLASNYLLTLNLTGGNFDTDIRGAHIHTAAGRCIVTSVANSTQVEALSYRRFTVSSFSTGNWKQYGVGHSYNTRYFVPVWVGNRPTHVGAWGQHASLLTGVSGAAMAYLASTEMCLESLLSVGDITHNMTLTSAMEAPDGTMRPLTHKGNAYSGELLCGIASGGGRDDIAWIPGWQQAGLIKPDANGRKRIFRNAECWNWQYSVPLRLTGPTPPTGNPTLPLKNDCGWESGSINSLATNYNFLRDQGGENWWGFDNDTAHQVAPHYIPYLLTGDYHWWLWSQQQEAFTCWMSRQDNLGTGGDGTSVTRNWCSRTADTIFGSFPTRGRAWPGRDQQMLAAIEPDNERSWLSNGKTYVLSRLSAAADGHAYWINDPRLISPLTGPVYDIRENEGTVPVGNANVSALNLGFSTPWTVGFWGLTVGAMKYLGLNNANWETFAPWLVRFWTESVSVSTVVLDIWTNTFQHVWRIDGSLAPSIDGVYPTSMGELYRRTMLAGPTNPKSWGEYRIVSGTYSITDPTSGTGRVITLPTSVFTGGGTGSNAFYVGGYIRDTSQGTMYYNQRTGGTFTAGDRMQHQDGDGYIVSGTIVSLLVDDGSAGQFTFKNASKNTTILIMSDPRAATSVSASNGAVAVLLTALWTNADRACARITSVRDARTVEVDVIHRFIDTSNVSRALAVPGPHPDDYGGEQSAVGLAQTPYQNRAGVAALAKYVGTTAVAPWLSAMAARSQWLPTTQGPWFYWKAKG